MKLRRRQFLHLAAGAAALPAISPFACRQISSEALAQPIVVSEIAPLGNLRVGMLGYNPALVTRKPDGSIGGVSANLGKFIAERLGLQLEPVVYATPESGVQSYDKAEWDMMIGPRGPAVERKADFGPDILLVDNIYVAAPGRDFADAGQVDKPGVKIGVVQNAVPDQFLSRTLKFAELVRVSAPIEIAVDVLRGGKVDVFASSGQYARAVALAFQAQRSYLDRFFLFTWQLRCRKGDRLSLKASSRRSSTRRKGPASCKGLLTNLP
jgi:hypothetical protein